MDGTSSVKRDFPNLKAYLDRHKRWRFYVRRKGQREIPLPGDPAKDPAALSVYLAATDQNAAPRKSTSTPAGSVRALLAEFYASDYWLNTLKPVTQRAYRLVYERWAATWGGEQVRRLTRMDAQRMLDERAATPAAARNLLKRLRILFDFAMDREPAWRPDNPFRTIRLKALATEGFAPWSDADIEQFKAHWPAGTKQRRALALLLHTTQRRSDVHRMAPAHLVGGCIDITQVKGRRGVAHTRLLIPLHPELAAELASVPADAGAFVERVYGEAYSAEGFSNWFTRQARLAGLVDRTPHGLRKAGARHHAEAGSGAPQIAAMTGHKSLAEVERYIRSAQQPKLARLAMDAVEKVRHLGAETQETQGGGSAGLDTTTP